MGRGTTLVGFSSRGGERPLKAAPSRARGHDLPWVLLRQLPSGNSGPSKKQDMAVVICDGCNFVDNDVVIVVFDALEPAKPKG